MGGIDNSCGGMGGIDNSCGGMGGIDSPMWGYGWSRQSHVGVWVE